MPGDYSRMTFDPRDHYSGVLMQQGRVLLDADWNEHGAIVMHYLQALAADLIGPHGGPGTGFEITAAGAPADPVKFDVAIGVGRYYVDGILCENEGRWEAGATAPAPPLYTDQPDYPVPDGEKLAANGKYLVYLDVWHREVTCLEDDGIREPALRGPDTAARSKVVWQVKARDVTGDGAFKEDDAEGYLRAKLLPVGTGKLRARAGEPSAEDTEPCTVAPGARFRGAENQLYRVEIHAPGKAGVATFVWSRDNASVAFPVTKTTSQGVELENLGRDDRSTLQNGDWVEILDDALVLQRQAKPLLQVRDIHPDGRTVRLSGPPPQVDLTRHPLLRRWDHGRPGGVQLTNGAIPVTEGAWLDIEDGIQILFAPPKGVADYQTGDYWLIPARTATGDVDWPGPADNPETLPARGVRHHYAPLRLVTLDAAGVVTPGKTYRRSIAIAQSAG
jgi:hypothetical protein